MRIRRPRREDEPLASAIGGTAQQLLKTLFDAGTAAGHSDRALLERFASSRDAGAEVAFGAIVERHGPMVLRVCRDILRDPHDADDAFQATFVVLARRAASIRRRESVGPWLYGVALRVAARARAARARRRDIERRGAEMLERNDAHPDGPDIGPLIHEEVGRLPEKYRAAIVLCYLEGLTHDQAAGQLGWPVGTVRSRLAWARERLRLRLVRRGLAPSAAVVGVSATEGGTLLVPASLIEATVRMALGASRAGTVPASVAILAGEELRRWVMIRLSWLGTGLVATGLAAAVGVRYVAAGQGPAPAEAPRSRAAAAAEPSGRVEPTTFDDAPRDNATKPRREGYEVPKILAARLERARLKLAYLEPLHKRAAISAQELFEAQNEVSIVTAQLEALRDDLRDELELLKAQLDIRVAELQLAQTSARWAEAEAERSGRNEARVLKSRVQVKEAEVGEVKVRIMQVKRRLDGAEAILKKATSPLPGAPSDPASSPAPK
jgi:RNA polymerase sigma factor (sigma-70 family)